MELANLIPVIVQHHEPRARHCLLQKSEMSRAHEVADPVRIHFVFLGELEAIFQRLWGAEVVSRIETRFGQRREDMVKDSIHHAYAVSGRAEDGVLCLGSTLRQGSPRTD